MRADDAPGRRFDAMAELRFSLAELHLLISKLGAVLGADDDSAQAITWDQASWRAADLYERAVTDLGLLSAKYMRIVVADKFGSPGGLDGI